MAQKKSNSKQSDSSNGKKNEESQNAYFLSLELENVRCFGELQTVDFSDKNKEPKQWTIILGDNGTGKTTLLRSIISLVPVSVEIPVYKSTVKFENGDDIEFERAYLAIYSENHRMRLNWELNQSDKNRKFYLSAYLINKFGLNSNKNNGTICNIYYHNRESLLSSALLQDEEVSELNIFAYGADRKMEFFIFN